jgi:hypothetical protein
VFKLSPYKSNGSVAGIVSMPSVSAFGYIVDLQNVAGIEANQNLATPDEFVKNYESVMSKVFAIWLVIHTVPAPATLVQRRVTKILTKLPSAAFWLLVTANLLFVLLGLSLSVLAARATSQEVHQVHTRLSTTGIAAQLFDWQHSRRAIKDDFELFKENTAKGCMTGVKKRISTRYTELGGADFVTHEVLDTSAREDEQARPLQTRQMF